MSDQGKSIEQRAIAWATGDDTGMSSLALLAAMTGSEPRYGDWAYPHDGGDLGRCLRLLERIPEWKPRMKEMRGKSKQWAALVDHWDELARMHAANDRNLYGRMQAILRPIEEGDPNIIVLGKGISMRVHK